MRGGGAVTSPSCTIWWHSIIGLKKHFLDGTGFLPQEARRETRGIDCFEVFLRIDMVKRKLASEKLNVSLWGCPSALRGFDLFLNRQIAGRHAKPNLGVSSNSTPKYCQIRQFHNPETLKSTVCTKQLPQRTKPKNGLKVPIPKYRRCLKILWRSVWTVFFFCILTWWFRESHGGFSIGPLVHQRLKTVEWLGWWLGVPSIYPPWMLHLLNEDIYQPLHDLHDLHDSPLYIPWDDTVIPWSSQDIPNHPKFKRMFHEINYLHHPFPFWGTPCLPPRWYPPSYNLLYFVPTNHRYNCPINPIGLICTN